MPTEEGTFVAPLLQALAVQPPPRASKPSGSEAASQRSPPNNPMVMAEKLKIAPKAKQHSKPPKSSDGAGPRCTGPRWGGRRRIRALNPVEAGRRRGGPDAVRSLQAAGGEVPVVGTILEHVQIDHTVIDVIVIDERERKPIGRPYLTAAIDVCSRSLVGMVVTLEAPSAVSVGLCLAHAGTEKRPWLESFGVDAPWPMSGKPQQLCLGWLVNLWNTRRYRSVALVWWESVQWEKLETLRCVYSAS